MGGRGRLYPRFGRGQPGPKCPGDGGPQGSPSQSQVWGEPGVPAPKLSPAPCWLELVRVLVLSFHLLGQGGSARIQKRLEGKIHGLVNRADQGRPLTQEGGEEGREPGAARGAPGAGFQHAAEDKELLLGCLGPEPPLCSPVWGRLFGLASEPRADKQEPRRKREVAKCWGERVGVRGASGDASLSPQAGEGDGAGRRGAWGCTEMCLGFIRHPGLCHVAGKQGRGCQEG